MNDKKSKIIQITSYVNLGLLCLTGIMFLLQLIRIYSNKSTPIYSREVVGKHLLELLPLIVITILLIIFTGIYLTLYGVARKNKITLSNEQKYKALVKNLGEPENKKERKIRLILKIVNSFVFIVSIFFCLFYIFTNNHFVATKDITEQVVTSLIHFAPWLLISLISSIVVTIFIEKSYKKEIELIKNKSVDLSKKAIKKPNMTKVWIIRGVVIALAVFLIVCGVKNGDAHDVLVKARNICAECIGLG